MRMLDLFCGRGGWTNAFLARGWECAGIDLNPQPEYRGRFVQMDVLDLRVEGKLIGIPFVGAYAFDFICASSPCEQFSVHGMKHFHPNPKYPENGIRLFNHTREICEASGVPYVMENVRAAQQFVGKAVHHCGPFYLWGNGVPMLMAQGIKKAQDYKAKYPPTPEMQRRGLKTEMFHIRSSMSSKERAGIVATIPLELAGTVATYAERLLEQSDAAKTGE